MKLYPCTLNFINSKNIENGTVKIECGQTGLKVRFNHLNPSIEEVEITAQNYCRICKHREGEK